MNAFPCLAALALILAADASAADWPNWRGPDHNGVSTETNWTAHWPADGPTRLWKAEVGTGFSSLSVSHGRCYTMGNRNGADVVYCLNAETGRVLWAYSYLCDLDPHYFEGGPTVTPTVDGASVYTLSRKGDLFCFAADTGKVIWERHLDAESAATPPSWGFAGSPLVMGGALILNAGDTGMAVNKNTGQTLWGGSGGNAAYASAVPLGSAAALLTGQEALAVNVADGKVLWRHPWEGFYGCNAADPIIADDTVFISSGYDRGAALLRVQNDAVTVSWKNQNMRNHINSCVLSDGYLYGIDGQVVDPTTTRLKCLDLRSGAVRWEFSGLGGGSLMIADKKIIALSDRGELFVADASPAGFQPISRAQVLGGKCWTVPVLANGRIYCRNARGDVICLDVRKN